VLIPYLSPELIAAILGDESATAFGMHTDPKPAVENSVPVQSSSSTVNEKPVPAPFRWNVSRLFAVVANLLKY
jgi:hypothetical protein